MGIYKNLHNVPLFGKYTDPYKDRCVAGTLRPDTPLDCATPCYKQEYLQDKLYFSWLGHSSVFVILNGAKMLIDPIFSKYASPVPFLGPKRFDGNTVTPEDFDVIDSLLITHDHYDHLDKATVCRFDNRVKAYVVPMGVKNRLLRWGIDASKVTELAWEQTATVAGVTITGLPTQHDSGRSPFSMNRTLWCSYLLQSGGYTVYDSGDGGFSDHFSMIHTLAPDIDLAIMECGQYSERWHSIHMFPEETVEACCILQPKLTIPVHFGAYVLSQHAWNEPPIRFSRYAEETGINYRLPKLYELVTIEK